MHVEVQQQSGVCCGLNSLRSACLQIHAVDCVKAAIKGESAAIRPEQSTSSVHDYSVLVHRGTCIQDKPLPGAFTWPELPQPSKMAVTLPRCACTLTGFS